MVDLPQDFVRQIETVDVPASLWWNFFHVVGEVLIITFQETIIKAVSLDFGRHIDPEEDAVSVFHEEPTG